MAGQREDGNVKGATAMQMNRIFLASIIAAGAMTVANVWGDDGSSSQNSAVQNAGNKTENAASSAGESIRKSADEMTAGSTTQPGGEAADAKDIRKTLRQVTQAALTKGDFSDVVDRFVTTDRDRLKNDAFTSQNHAILDGRIAQFEKDWQAKYNQSFKIHDLSSVYDNSFATITQERNPDNAQVASEQESAQSSAEKSQTPPSQDKSVQPGRSVATVTLAATTSTPALAIPLVHEFPDHWAIDVPDTYSAQQLHDNLLTQLTMLDEHKDQWPSDVNEAYRDVTRHVLMAVMGANGTNIPNAMHENNSDLNAH
jgi:hypothetical protein